MVALLQKPTTECIIIKAVKKPFPINIHVFLYYYFIKRRYKHFPFSIYDHLQLHVIKVTCVQISIMGTSIKLQIYHGNGRMSP